MKIFITIMLIIAISITGLTQATVDSSKKWSYHFQLTAINQTHLSFKATYSGNNSLSNDAENKKLSLTTTLFLGRKLWKNAALYFNDGKFNYGAGDYQFVNNPAYNKDRGPVHVFAIRGHVEF